MGEAELARLRIALQDTNAAAGVRSGFPLERHSESSRACGSNIKFQESSPIVGGTERSLYSRIHKGLGEVDSSTEYARGTLVVEVDAERAEWLRDNTLATSSAAE